MMQEMQERRNPRRPAVSSEAPRFVLSFGGGVNSVALMILLVEEGLPLNEAVFADTGAEVPETYAYLETAREYLEDHGIRLVEVRKNGDDLYATCLRRQVIPSAVWRWSTRDFKVRPIRSYYKRLRTPIVQYVAIAYDELERMRSSEDDWIRNEYPLVDRRLTRADCVDIIERAGLAVPVKSGCYFCPFNSLSRWHWLKHEHPDLFQSAIVLEEASKHFPTQRLTDQVFRSSATVTLRDLPTNSRFVSMDSEMPCGGECHT
jgi:Phosphoadenosine phosphosulfate reductase family